jgi:hypothetical protein
MADPITVILNRDVAKIIVNAFCMFNIQCGKPVQHSMTWNKIVTVSPLVSDGNILKTASKCNCRKLATRISKFLSDS